VRARIGFADFAAGFFAGLLAGRAAGRLADFPAFLLVRAIVFDLLHPLFDAGALIRQSPRREKPRVSICNIIAKFVAPLNRP
jgi:hypothetical protein